jgi:hypothetical protein
VLSKGSPFNVVELSTVFELIEELFSLDTFNSPDAAHILKINNRKIYQRKNK